MRARVLLACLPAAWLLTVAATQTPTPTPAATASASPTPAPPVTPTPAPYHGTLGNTPTLGPPGTTVTVTGTLFAPGSTPVIYWDTSQKPLGGVTADKAGSFKTDVKAPDGDPTQPHKICAAVAGVTPDACADFKLEAATPSPTPTPVATATPTPAATPPPAVSPGPTLAPRDTGISPVAALLQPPFVIFPVLAALAAIGGAVYWIVAGTRRRPAPVGPARVSHASVRPPGPQGPPGTPIEAPPPSDEPPPPPAEPPAPPPGPRPLGGGDSIDLPKAGD